MNNLIKDENGLVKTGEYTAVNPQFQAPINPRVAAINASIAAQGNKGYSVAPSALPSTITSDALNGNEQPINLTQPKPSTLADGISGASTALLEFDKLKQEAAKETADREAKLAETESKQTSLLERIGLAKKDITTKGREEFGLDTLEPTRRKALQDLRTSQVRELSELKALEGQNMTETGSLTAQYGIKRKYGMDQLEAQLSYYIANDDITAAEKTINDRIALETEPLYAQLDLTKNVYTQISNSLSKSEDKEWNLKIDEITQKIQTTEKVGEFAKTVAANGAPADVISRVSSAKTMEEAIQAAGSYAGDVLDRQYKMAQIAKLYSEITNSGQSGTITGKPQTASQSAANLYADRLNQADVSISTLGSGMTGTLDFGGSLPNFLQTGDRQAYEQAKRNFVTAVLRRESGAAISPTEFETADLQYFPQRGDKPETIKQKENLRNTVINNFYKEANVLRPVLPGQIIESGGKRYKVGLDGETLEEIK